MTSKELQARERVNMLAAGGGTIAAAAIIPGATSLALIALESYMILEIGKIYRGDTFNRSLANDLAATGIATSAGFVAQLAAQELLNLVPGYGWVVKGGIAASTIKLMGEAIVHYFETHETDCIILSWSNELKRLVALSPDGDVMRTLSPRTNWEMGVMDKKVAWRVLGTYEGWEVQRNKIFGNCRVLSPEKTRVAWAKTESELRAALRQ